MATKKWSDLGPAQQRVICVAGAAELVMTMAALRDLARRSADQVRGPKAMWRLGVFVQPVGPLAHFAAGRR